MFYPFDTWKVVRGLRKYCHLCVYILFILPHSDYLVSSVCVYLCFPRDSTHHKKDNLDMRSYVCTSVMFFQTWLGWFHTEVLPNTTYWYEMLNFWFPMYSYLDRRSGRVTVLVIRKLFLNFVLIYSVWFSKEFEIEENYMLWPSSPQDKPSKQSVLP